MDKVRVRHLVKPGNTDLRSMVEPTFEVDPLDREVLSRAIECELEDSLDELERTLKKRNPLFDL